MSIQALKDYIEENKRVWSSPIHGINHWEHVWSNGQEVGWAVDADLEVVVFRISTRLPAVERRNRLAPWPEEPLSLLTRTVNYSILVEHNLKN